MTPIIPNRLAHNNLFNFSFLIRKREVDTVWEEMYKQRERALSPQSAEIGISREEDTLREKCAVVGVFSKSRNVAPLLYLGLAAQQHRGQETSGITTANGQLTTHKAPGLVSQAYSTQDLASLEGQIGIGHNRYSTSGSSEKHLQPVTSEKNLVALAHNGTLPETKKLEAFLQANHVETNGLNDSELMQRAVEHFFSQGMSIEDALRNAYPLFTGAFSLVVATKDTLLGLRDSYGIRPLSVGSLNGDGYMLSSETCGIDAMGGKFLRDVLPGEMVAINKNGIFSHQIEKGQEKLDIFEIVYFARPDSYLYGKSVNGMRREMGRQLAREQTIDADMVLAVPNSSIPAAAGYSEATGIPYEPNALIKDSYTHRTFINPSLSARADGVRRKFIPIPEVIRGKSIAVIDDSIVRGTTSRELVAMLRDAGARSIHLIISSPPIKFPDFYGIATPTQKELIASHMNVEQIREFVGADTLQYLSFDGMIQATGLPEDKFNTSCFTGIYPIDIGDNAKDIDFSVEMERQILNRSQKLL